MKKRNFLFTSFILSLGIAFSGCNFGNGGNITNFPGNPVVAIDYSSDFTGVIFGTYWGYCVAPAANIYPGDCTVMSFSIDYDNQPAGAKYPLASNVALGDIIGISSFESSDSVRISDYTLPISNAACISSPFYEGKVFFGISCKDNGPRYRLIYNRQEPDSAGVKNLYLLAQPSSSSASDVAKNCAFDLSYLIQNNGTVDTEGTITGVTNAKYIKANLKYLTGISNDGTPAYNTIINPDQPGNPFIFLMFQ